MTSKHKHIWTKKRGAKLGEDLDHILGDLCVRWGFCNRLLGRELLSEGSINADAFADAVLRAEGMDPLVQIEWRRKMKRAFVERYGQNEISEVAFGG